MIIIAVYVPNLFRALTSLSHVLTIFRVVITVFYVLFFYLLLFLPLLPFVPKLFRVLITVAYVGKAFLKSLVVYVPEISHEDSKEFKYIAERN